LAPNPDTGATDISENNTSFTKNLHRRNISRGKESHYFFASAG
jgi:hypothetical protein